MGQHEKERERKRERKREREKERERERKKERDDFLKIFKNKRCLHSLSPSFVPIFMEIEQTDKNP